MALTAKKVYAILKRQISDMEAKLNSPVRYRGTVATADLLPLNPDIGDMYNIESKSVYGEAGMNVAWNGVVWDTMGAPIDMSLYFKEGDIPEWALQPEKPTYTAEETGALPADTKIPSKTSDLQNDSGFLTKIPDNYLSGTDKTLSASGKAADAKVTGEKIAKNSADITKKLDKNQGVENSGKIAGINASGDIVPMFPMGVEYNSETNCLEFGSDQKMKLNQGIGLDSSLTKTGYAADAGVVGEVTNSLKEDLGDINASVFNIEVSPNIFDKTKINQDKALVTWGTPTLTNYTYDKTGWVVSYPIAVRGGSTIHVYKFENGVIKNQSIANLITFAKDGSFIAIEGQNKNEIKLSENTAYIIFDISNSAFVDSLMLTTEPYNGVYQAYGVKKEDKIAKNAEDILKLKNDKTHIIFSFDAFKIDNRFELMKSYGFPFTIAIAQTILTYPISKNDYYNYFIDGNVDFSVYAGKGDRPSDYRSDKDKWSSWVKGLVDGLKETSGLYYPVMYSCQNAASSDILNQVVKENGFRMCRNGTYYNADGTTTWGVLTDRKYLIDGTKYFDYYPLSVVKQEGYPTVEEIKTEIDNAIEKKKSIMLFTHYVKEDSEEMSDTDCPLSKFTAVLDYVKEKVDAGLCDVKNARQFWNYYNQQDGLDIDYKRTNMRNLFDTTN